MLQSRDATDAGLSSHGKDVVGLAVAAVLLAGTVVALRFYTRGVWLRVLGIEDWSIGLALLFSIGNTVGMCMQANFLGRHIWTLTPQEIILFLKSVYFTIVCYNTSLSFTKLSIVLLYLRLFNLVYLRKATYATLVFVIVINLWSVFSSVLFCLPLPAYWDRSVAGKCLPREARWVSGATLNIVSDFVILVLPLPTIWRLSIARRQKIGLWFVFALGLFICVVSILRLPVLIAAAKSKDPTGDNPAVAKWSIVELNTAIICASLITLRPLIFCWFPGLLGSADADEQSGPLSDLMQRTVGSASTPGRAANRHDSLLRSGNDWWTSQCESTDQASSTILGGATKEQSARGAGVAVGIASNEV